MAKNGNMECDKMPEEKKIDDVLDTPEVKEKITPVEPKKEPKKEKVKKKPPKAPKPKVEEKKIKEYMRSMEPTDIIFVKTCFLKFKAGQMVRGSDITPILKKMAADGKHAIYMKEV